MHTSAPASRAVIVDNTPPDTQITDGPSGQITETAATFTFTGTDNLTPPANLVFAWRLDSGAFTPLSASASASLSGLGEGAHTFEVKARDLAGNEDVTPATRTFSVVLGPRITSVDPASGPVGTFVTVTGSNFVPGATQVAFSGAAAAVVRTVTPTSVTTTVPFGALTGPLTLTTPQGQASHPFTVTRTSDFTLTAAPAQATTVQGGQVGYAITAHAVNGFTGLVQLIVSGAPADVVATLSPGTLAPGQTGTLTVQTAAGTTVGVRSLTVLGSTRIDGATVTVQQTVALAVLAGGVTALIGRVLDTDALPVRGVTLTLAGSAPVQTDAGGNFLMTGIPAGADQFLMIDGSTAMPDRRFPLIPVVVTILPDVVNTLPFTPFLHEQKNFNFTTIVPGQETVVTDPEIPGLELRIPADVSIVGWDGQVNTKVSVRTVPLDRMPLPHPDPPIAARSLYMFYFDKAGGGTPTRPVPFTAPNDLGLAPGATAELWYYDEGPTPGSATFRWQLAGTGTVSADGQTITTDAGVGIPKFCCGATCWAAQTNPSVGAQGLTPYGVRGADPVDLATGLFVLEKTDLALPGRVPLVLTRTYRNDDPTLGPFGVGTSAFFTEILRATTPQSLTYVLPGNARITFARQPDGSFVNPTTPEVRGARITVTAGDTRTLRRRDGATRVFEPILSSNPPAFQLRSLADRQGTTITLQRDAQGRPIALTDANGRTLELTFGGPGLLQVTRVRDPLGRLVRYDYDPQGRLVTVTDPNGGQTAYTYDGAGRMATLTDARGIPFLTNVYSGSGRVLRQLQGDGGEWRLAYMVSGARVTGPGCPGVGCPEIESEATVQQGYTFAGGYVVATMLSDPRGQTTTYRFNSFGTLTERIDALGQSTKYERAEGTNLLLSTTDPLGRRTALAYDATGNVTSITTLAGTPHAGTTSFTHEPVFNQVASVTDPLNQTMTLGYDGAGNIHTLTDALGQSTSLTHDASGQPLSVTDPLNHTTQLSYAAGLLATLTDPLGRATTYTRDGAGRLVTTTDPRGTRTHVAYGP